MAREKSPARRTALFTFSRLLHFSRIGPVVAHRKNIAMKMLSYVKFTAWVLVVFNIPACIALKPSKPILNEDYKWPTVVVAVLVRNKAHTLPYFLSCISNLEYPKERMYIWIYTDYNSDESIEIIHEWAKVLGDSYNGVNITAVNDTGPLHSDEEGLVHWSPMHFKHVIRLREDAMGFARKKWADFIFMIDADAFITDSKALKTLVKKDLTIAAPMLATDGLYSNFWCGMTEQYYYKRTDDYKPILYRQDKGCFSVPMVHTAVLISLRHLNSDKLTYNPQKLKGYEGPQDDVITFAVNAVKNGMELFICNDIMYGFMAVPLEEKVDLKEDFQQMRNVKLEALSRGVVMPLLNLFAPRITYPKQTKWGLSEIFVINLERRVERKRLMALSFQELGMNVTFFKAVDGRNIDLNNLNKLSITLMPNYEDPYYKRPMKTGEIGCFMSHYRIWQKIVKKRYSMTLILEDDIHFASNFRKKFEQVRQELNTLDWDLLYLGRKILLDGEEQYATEHITRPLYSYWTLGYMITRRGAQKLLDAKPLTKLLPVDEFLPIMFDQHPNATWKSMFPKRNLIAFSAAPLLVNPTHYTGQEGYISDTEDSDVVENAISQDVPFVRTDF